MGAMRLDPRCHWESPNGTGGNVLRIVGFSSPSGFLFRKQNKPNKTAQWRSWLTWSHLVSITGGNESDLTHNAVSNSQKSGYAALLHVIEGRVSPKHWIRIRQRDPSISELLAVKNVQSTVPIMPIARDTEPSCHLDEGAVGGVPLDIRAVTLPNSFGSSST